MARTKKKDLPVPENLSQDEMKNTVGGGMGISKAIKGISKAIQAKPVSAIPSAGKLSDILHGKVTGVAPKPKN